MLTDQERAELKKLVSSRLTSVPELVTAIDEYIAHHNAHRKQFIWTRSVRDILRTLIRANDRLRAKQNATLH